MMRILAARAAIGLAAAALFWSASAQALGLGEVEVRSHLNERFSATIPLVSASAEDLDSLVLSVASPEEFARSGVDRADAVSDLSFIRSGNGIRVSSREPIRDPFLTFIVEARWNGGRLLREYTVLLDPPGRAAASAPVPPQVTVPAASPSRPVTPPVVVIPAGAVPVPAPAPVAAPSPAVATAAISPDGRYGPVQPGQTLWSVARAVLADSGVSHEQMVLALYQANPQAFVGGDIDQLLKGSRLKVPSAADAGAVDAATARARVAELRKARPAAAVDAPVPAPAIAPALLADAAPAPAATPAAAPTVNEPAPAADPVPAPAVSPGAEAAAAVDPLAAPAEPPVTDLPPAAAPDGVVAEPDVAAPPSAVEPAPAIVNRPAPAVPPVDDAPFSWPLAGGLLLLILALIAVKLRGRKAANGLPAPRRVGNVVEPLAAGADALMDSPRPRSRPAEDDDAKTVLKPLLPAADAAAAEAPAAAPTPDPQTEADADADDGGLPALGSLDAADPMTEADFHLAYGLYDEAAQMLKTAIAADPARSELKVKLAEVWSAAGKADEFRQLAEGMAGTVSAAEWQKVSTLGRAILPDLALFRGTDAAAAPAAPVAPTVAPSLPMSAPAEALRDLSVIDFDLDSEAPSPRPMPVPPASAPVAEPQFEARLAAFDEPALPATDEPVLALPPLSPALDFVVAPEPPPPAIQAEPDADRMVDLDLSSFDLEDEGAAKAADPGRVEFTMADLDAVADEPLELDAESEVIGDDEVDTKLGLARVYADMGDDDAARVLLDEVLSSGTDKQQQEARALRQRLAG